MIETTFEGGPEHDLFGEQAAVCGDASELVGAGRGALVEAGYDPPSAYYGCRRELKLNAI